MAAPKVPDCEGKEKDLRIGGRKKLVVGEKVEVRSLEDGFWGSWHSGIVVACGNRARHVKYDHIVDDNTSRSLVECFDVSTVIDGISDPVDLTSSESRGLIRPSPPPCWVKGSLCYGLCVDAFHKEAWWEGVIFDHEDGSEERSVFFPDLGDELKITIEMLRITQDWNEATEVWKRRGNWLFLELIEEYGQEWPLCASIKQIWYDLRIKEGFENAGEWTRPVKALWKDLVLKTIEDNFKLSVKEFIQMSGLSEDTREGCQSKFISSVPAGDISLLHADMKPTDTQPIDDVFNLDELLPQNCDDDLGTGISPSINSGMLCHDKLGCFQPPDLLVLPLNPDGVYNEHNCKTKVSINRSQRWLPVGSDILPRAEFCAGVITEYALHFKGIKNKNYSTLTTKVRKHLAYLGWRMEFATDKASHSRSKKGMTRLRYISPDGSLCYSLNQVCQKLQDYDRDIQSPFSENVCRSWNSSPNDGYSSKLIERRHMVEGTSDVLSSSDAVVVEPEYCPQAVRDWYQLGNKECRHQSRTDMSEKAKKHLASLGWTFWYAQKANRRELRYSSPTGRSFYSLRAACKCCIDKDGIFKSNAITDKQAECIKYNQLSKSPEGLRATNALPERLSLESPAKSQSVRLVELSKVNREFGKYQRKRKLSNTSHQKMKRQKLSGGLIEGGSYPSRVLRSKKRARHLVVPSSSHKKPRTVLSLLIEYNVVLPRARVQYRSRKNRHPSAEGQITHDGIKCNCCKKVFTLGSFESHAGSSSLHPAAYIFLEDGRSLLECQKQIICNNETNDFASESWHSIKGNIQDSDNDPICSICHYGGDLVLCDQCPSSFHTNCLGLKDVPTGDWFCPSCCCRICGQGSLNRNAVDDMDNSFLNCDQCQHQYHFRCLRKNEPAMLETYPKEKWFCSTICEKIFMGLQKLLEAAVPVGVDLTWRLLKSKKYDGCDFDGTDVEAVAENYCKLRVAVGIMHECFEPVQEPDSSRDLVEDVIFSRGSQLKRLNFQGFYTALLERNDELISVATIRVHGQKVAEVPLVGTQFRYRRLGMCRILLNELEKNLTEIGVERLVLPAAPSVLNTWTGSFGFKMMTDSERLEFLDCTFLDFQDTVMCQKLLTTGPSLEARAKNRRGDNIEVDDYSPVSGVFQPEQIEESEITDQGSLVIGSERKHVSEFKCYRRRKDSASGA